jgi:hypothetical protein
MPTTDGHWPVWRIVPGLGTVIACECGANPRRASSRSSMQHVWHQTHRRGLRLQPVEYAWPHDEDYHRDGALSTGGLVQVRNAEWVDGGWRTR